MKRIVTIILCIAIVLPCVFISANAKKRVSKPSKVKGVKVSRLNKSTLKVSWGKAKNTTGYQLSMKTDGGKFKVIKTTSKRYYTKKGLTLSKSYYFKVRAYKKYKVKTYYGAYSDIKKFKLTSWVYLVDAIKPYSYSSYTYYSGANSFKMAGLSYYHGFVMNRDSDDTHYILFNLNGKFKNISFAIGAEEGEESADESTIMFYSDDDLIKSIHRKKDDLPQKATLNIADTYKFKIIRSDYIAVGFGNVKLYY